MDRIIGDDPLCRLVEQVGGRLDGELDQRHDQMLVPFVMLWGRRYS